jgi:hypothetical protein
MEQGKTEQEQFNTSHHRQHLQQDLLRWKSKGDAEMEVIWEQTQGGNSKL